MTAKISAVGAGLGAALTGPLGPGTGIATGGAAISATVPFAAAGAAIGSWAGPALALVGIGTAPAWAVPVAVGGQILVGASLVAGTWKLARFGYQRLHRVDGRRAMVRATGDDTLPHSRNDMTCRGPLID